MDTAVSSGDVHAFFAQWLELAAFVAVRASLPRSDTSLAVALTWSEATARLEDWAQKLCDATGWDRDTVVSLLDATGFASADWALPGTTIVARLLARLAGPVPTTGVPGIGERLALLQRCIALVKRVGVTAATLHAWAATEPDAAAADQVIQAVRAAYPITPSGCRSRRRATTRCASSSVTRWSRTSWRGSRSTTPRRSMSIHCSSTS